MPIVYAYEHHQTIAEGLTIRTDPPEGTLVSEGATVTVYVSLGPSTVKSFRVSHSNPKIRASFG